MRIQFDLLSEYSRRLLKFPGFPNWRGRENFYIQVFIAYINSKEFRLKELEHENRVLPPRWTLQNRPLIDTSKPATTGMAAETSEFYFVASSVRKSVWTFVRQLRGPHLRTCA